MWLEGDGVAHTIALPRPKQLMTKRFRADLDALLQGESRRVRAILRGEEDVICDGLQVESADLRAQRPYIDQTPPVRILRGALERPEDVCAAIGHVEAPWRLDCVIALRDYVDR